MAGRDNMRFWSTIAPASDGREPLTGTALHTIAAPGVGMLHVAGLSFMAAPDPARKSSVGPTFVYAEIGTPGTAGHEQVCVACLSWGVCEMMRVELFFERSVTFFVSEGGSPVQLTGCVLGEVGVREVDVAAESDNEDSGSDESSESGDGSSRKRAAAAPTASSASAPASKRARAKGTDSRSEGSSSSGSEGDSSDGSSSSEEDDASVPVSPGDKLILVVRDAINNGREKVHIEDIARLYKSRFGAGFRDESGQKLGKFLKKDQRFLATGGSQWKIAKR
jgi:hypothetical protein